MRWRAGVLALMGLLLAGGASAQWWGSMNATHVQGKKVTAPVAGDDNKCLTYDLATQGLVWDTCGVSTATANTWTAPQSMGYLTLSSAGGTNEVVNGSFTSSATGWTVAGGWAYGTNNVTHSTTDTTALQPSTPLTVASGGRWKVCFTISGYSGSGTVTPSIGGTNGAARSANGTYCDWIGSISTANLTFTPSATAFVGTLDNVSAMEDSSILLQNSQVSTATTYASNRSPLIRWESHGWDTDDAVDRTYRWANYLTTSSAASVYGTITWAVSADGGSWTDRLSVNNAGRLSGMSAVFTSSGEFLTLEATSTVPTTTGGLRWYPSVTSAAAQTGIRSAATFAPTTGTPGIYKSIAIEPTYNITGTAAGMTATDLFINRTETALGTTPGAQYLIDAQVGGVSQFRVTNVGGVVGGAIAGTSITANSFGASSGGVFTLGSTGLALEDAGSVLWSSTASSSGAKDLGLARNAAGVLEVNTGTAGTVNGSIVANTIMQQYGLDATAEVGMAVCIDESPATCTGDCVSPCASGSEKPIGSYVGTAAGTAHASTQYLIATSGKAYTIPEEDHADVAAGDVVVTATGVAGYCEYSAGIPATHNQELGHAIRASAKQAFNAEATPTGGVDTTANSIKLAGTPTGWAVDDPVVIWDSGDTLPTFNPAVTEGQVLWIKTISTDTVTLSTSKGGAALDITAAGTGTTCYLQKLAWVNLHFN